MQIETTIFNGLLSIMGTPLALGVFFLMIVLAFCIFCRINEGGIIVIMIGAVVVASCFIQNILIIVGIAVGIAFGLAMLKIMR